jgi:rifampicin phosphotransferase
MTHQEYTALAQRTAPAFPLVVALDDPAATLELAGGKGASLARLAAAGLPVPAGFHVTTAAYGRFVAENGLQHLIVAAAAAAVADNPATLEQAARRIEDLFARASMPAEIVESIQQSYAALGAGDLAVAVRSSATAEDLPELSFAGQQETYLNICGAASVLAAVQRCWASLWTARAIGYRARHGIAPDDVGLAVVVQELVPADAAGVLFTANPLTGARDQLVINAAWGLGEAIVGGQVTPDTLVVDRTTAAVIEQQISRKEQMTVRTAEGTREQPVPAEQRDRAVLSPAQATELARLGLRIEQLYGQPMDIEWAVHGERMSIVQARPITTLREPLAEEWNDSLRGDYLWTSGNVGEAVPDVMTPSAWSLIQIFIADAMPVPAIDGHSPLGNIGGHFYMNISLLATVAAAFGVSRARYAEANEQAFGRLPASVHLPLIPISRWRVIRTMLPIIVRYRRRIAANKSRLPGFVAAAPARCQALRARIQATSSAPELIELWHDQVLPFFHECSHMLAAGARQDGAAIVWVRRELSKLVGEVDANALLSGLSGGASHLASLGLLIGLDQLSRGAIDRDTFARQYGHRGPHEFEISIARPAEDAKWVDQQLAGLRAAPVDVPALLARQQQAQADAWARFEQRFPRKAARMRRRIDSAAAAFRAREEARSEVIRTFWALRAFVQRAGALTGQGDDMFFLRIEEILDVLAGDQAPLARVPARRAAYARYVALPAYPAVIRGSFDPFRWAADPQRRSDLFDASGAAAPSSAAIRGFPGAEGVVEGRVRVIASVEQGDQLQPGEILVTALTNVGWTPLFPRCAAVVTDIGAPLSHAAIVARELGIPAVVGCGNATMRLHTGDRVRVDGGQGTVELIELGENP